MLKEIAPSCQLIAHAENQLPQAVNQLSSAQLNPAESSSAQLSSAQLEGSGGIWKDLEGFGRILNYKLRYVGNA